jgi:thiosulfate dehydrogenase
MLMRGFFAGIIITLVLIALGTIFYFKSGRAPVATADPQMPFEKTLARMGLHARMDKEIPQRDVSTFTTADLLSGADVYQKNCAFCHGLLQQPATGAAIGMFPKPPQLLTVKETVSVDPAGETYWKVKNGIRLTGMPGFSASLTDLQMWQVSALLARADKLPPEVQEGLKPGAVTAAAPPAMSPLPIITK